MTRMILAEAARQLLASVPIVSASVFVLFLAWVLSGCSAIINPDESRLQWDEAAADAQPDDSGLWPVDAGFASDSALESDSGPALRDAGPEPIDAPEGVDAGFDTGGPPRMCHPTGPLRDTVCGGLETERLAAWGSLNCNPTRSTPLPCPFADAPCERCVSGAITACLTQLRAATSFPTCEEFDRRLLEVCDLTACDGTL